MNNQLIIDQWSDHVATTFSGSISLVAGQAYSIRVEYYEHTGQAVIHMFWTGPSVPMQIVPLHIDPLAKQSSSHTGKPRAQEASQALLRAARHCAIGEAHQPNGQLQVNALNFSQEGASGWRRDNQSRYKSDA